MLVLFFSSVGEPGRFGVGFPQCVPPPPPHPLVFIAPGQQDSLSILHLFREGNAELIILFCCFCQLLRFWFCPF